LGPEGFDDLPPIPADLKKNGAALDALVKVLTVFSVLDLHRSTR
jgi:hypothetical protein